MAKDEEKLWMCRDCDAINLEHDLLTAKNPFDDTDTIIGCPKCFSVQDFIEICDEPDCITPASCGFPVKEGFGGYRRTCHKHSSL